MTEEKESSWVYTDETDELILVGNASGMSKFRDAISEAIEKGECCTYDKLDTTDIGKIVITNREDWDKGRKQPTTLKDRVLTSLAFTWFVVLPFVGLGMIIYVAAI